MSDWDAQSKIWSQFKITFFYWISFQYHISFFQFYWIPTESLNQFNFIFFHFYWIRFQLVFSFSQFGWISTELYFKFVLHLFSFFFNSTEFWLKGDSFGIQFFSFLLKIYWALKLQFKFSANSVLLNLNWSQFSRHSVFSVLLKSYWFGFSRASVFFSSTEFELNF